MSRRTTPRRGRPRSPAQPLEPADDSNTLLLSTPATASPPEGPADGGTLYLLFPTQLGPDAEVPSSYAPTSWPLRLPWLWILAPLIPLLSNLFLCGHLGFGFWRHCYRCCQTFFKTPSLPIGKPPSASFSQVTSISVVDLTVAPCSESPAGAGGFKLCRSPLPLFVFPAEMGGSAASD